MKTRLVLLFFVLAFLCFCVGCVRVVTKMDWKQTFDSTGVVKLIIKDYTVRGDVPAYCFDERLGFAVPASTDGIAGIDLSGEATINSSEINVTSDSTIIYNGHMHSKITDPNGNVFYYYEELKDDLKLAKFATKIVREDDNVIVTSYIISFDNKKGGTFEQFKKLYTDNLKAEQENNKAEILRQQKQGSTPKDLYENNYKVNFTEVEYTLD